MSALDTRCVFELAYYQNTQVFTPDGLEGAGKQAFLVTSSIADGTLTAPDLGHVCVVIREAIMNLPGITECAIAPVSFDMTDPWEHGGGPRLVFDNSWSVTGFHVEGTAAPHPPGSTLARIGVPPRTPVTHAWFACDPGLAVHDTIPGAFAQLASVSLVRGPVARPAVSPSFLR